MRNRLWFLFPAALLPLLAGCDLEDAIYPERYTQNFHYTYPLASGGRLTVENFNGSVDIAGWDQETIDISGTKHAATPQLRDAVKIDVAPAAGSISIRTVRPSDAQGSMGAKYVIKVPRRTQLERISSRNGPIRVSRIEGNARLKTSNSSVQAVALRGDLEVQTSNGSIEIEDLQGGASARTSNGRIHAQFAQSEAGRPISLETSNGGIELTVQSGPRGDIHASTQNGAITVYLPASASAQVKAGTHNASVSSDFDVKRQGTSNAKHLEGVIGSGGPMLELNTSNGSIRILKLM